MLSDLRFAFRTLATTPGFTAAAAIVLALGIGANVAIFSLVHTMLFKAPAYAHPNEIVQLFSQNRKDPQAYRGFSYPTYRDIREQNTVFSGLLAHTMAMVGIGEKGDTRRAFAGVVSANYFSVLGIEPARGRAFLPEEETPGRGAEVAIVSHSFWKKHGLDPAVLGSTLTLNGRPFTIVGIMPEGFSGTMQVISCEVWVPLGVYDEVHNDFQTTNRATLAERNSTALLLIGRLRPGVTATSAAPALAALSAGLERALPVEQKDQALIVAPLSRFSTSTAPNNDGGITALGGLLLGMAAVVLLVACLNLANMLLARGTARRKEIAIRLALGGGRARIVRQLLTEGFALSLLGGVGGLLLALWSSDLLVASLSRMMPLDIVWSTGPSPALLAATFGFCLLGTLGFALGPALKLSRASVIADLKEQAGEDPVRRRWKFLPRNPLVVVQIALSLALLTAATLFIRGATMAASVDTGLKTEHNFLLELDASLAGRNPAQAEALYNRLGEKLSALPGVERASIAATVPFGMVSLGKSVQRAGPRPAPDAKPATAAEGRAFSANWNSIGADYFATVGLPLLRGRAFTASETTQAGGPAVAIIDDTLARELWADGNAVGQRIQFESEAPTAATYEVVGVVPATRSSLFDRAGDGNLYLPFARGFQSNVFFHVRFAALAPGSESAAADLIRRTVREVDPALPVLGLKTFTQHLEGNLQLWIVRAGAALFSVFGGLALGLAVVGVYGVKAYSVARRTREIGVRMALGARPEAVQWMILREGLVMLGLGVAFGLLLAVGTGQILSGLLYHVGALDPVAFTAAPLILSAAALLACWLPARRATRIDPMHALRAQ